MRSPNELLEPLNAQQEEALTELTAEIERRLVAAGGLVRISRTELLNGRSLVVLNEFLDQAREAGWAVEEVNDQVIIRGKRSR